MLVFAWCIFHMLRMWYVSNPFFRAKLWMRAMTILYIFWTMKWPFHHTKCHFDYFILDFTVRLSSCTLFCTKLTAFRLWHMKQWMVKVNRKQKEKGTSIRYQCWIWPKTTTPLKWPLMKLFGMVYIWERVCYYVLYRLWCIFTDFHQKDHETKIVRTIS